MGTLYDVLGISRQADAAQIEQGYRCALAGLTGSSEQFEQDMIRAKAIREAHAILSSPARRQAYDEKLRQKEQVIYPVIEERPAMPWWTLGMIALALIAALGYYHQRAKQLEVLHSALETVKAKNAADAAARLAEAEEAKLAHAQLAEKRAADAARLRETEQARYEGQRVRAELQAAEAQAERKKESAQHRAKIEQAQEEYAARMRNQEREYAMRRALDIPIVQH